MDFRAFLGSQPGKTPWLAVILLSAMLMPASSCRGPVDKGSSGMLTVAGSTSVQPFAEKLAEEYMARRPDLNINVQGGGSTAGVRAAQSGVAQIGMSSRNLKPGEEGLNTIVIAYDGIAVIVHPSNATGDLSSDLIARIFAGEITGWEAVGGPPGDIHFVTREEGSGTRGAFESLVMIDRSISPRALVQDSNGAVREIVASDPKAMGYISLGIVDRRVKAVTVDGVEPSHDEIVSGRYAVVRPFLFLTSGKPEGAVKDFIDFVLGEDGQRLLAEEALITVKR